MYSCFYHYYLQMFSQQPFITVSCFYIDWQRFWTKNDGAELRRRKRRGECFGGAKLRYAALKTTEGFSFPFLSLIPLIPVSQSGSQPVALWTARGVGGGGSVGRCRYPVRWS